MIKKVTRTILKKTTIPPGQGLHKIPKLIKYGS